MKPPFDCEADEEDVEETVLYKRLAFVNKSPAVVKQEEGQDTGKARSIRERTERAGGVGE